MSGVVFSCLPGYGHFFPMLPIALELQRRGHQVRVASSAAFAPVVHSRGLDPIPVGLDWSQSEADKAFPGFTDLDGIGQAKIFASAIARATAPDLIRLFEDDRPDVLVFENWDFGAWAAGRKTGVRTVLIGITGQIPAAFYRMSVGHQLQDLLDDVAAAPDPELRSLTGELFIDPTPPSFAVNPPEGFVRRVRPAVPDIGTMPALLAWLDADAAPLIYVTLGTVFNRTKGLMEKVLAAMAELPVRVVAATGPATDPDDIRAHRKVFVQPFVPQATVIAHSAVVVSHAGRGTVFASLAAGVPLCLLPLSADQPAVAKRCAQIGVGIVCATGEVGVGPDKLPVLEPLLLSPTALRQAVRSLLEDSSYRDRAKWMQREIDELPPSEMAAVWIEALASSARPR